MGNELKCQLQPCFLLLHFNLNVEVDVPAETEDALGIKIPWLWLMRELVSYFSCPVKHLVNAQIIYSNQETKIDF